nr:putative reverse transcriptase domain-containing protein [Tanacetum cinerariifolium]
ESSHDSTLEQHGKQIEEILNHLDELPLDHIERIEDDGEIVIENHNHLNDPNIPEGDQAPAAPDGFAPQWIKVDKEVMDDDDDWEDDVEWLLAPMTPPRATVGEQVESRVDTYSSGQMEVPGQDEIVGLSPHVQTLQTALHGTELQNQQLRTRVAEMESHVGILMSYMLWMEERLTVLEKRLLGPPPGPQTHTGHCKFNSFLSFPFLFIVLETFPCVLIDDVTLTKSKEESINHGTQARKYIENACKIFLAQVTKQGSKEKRLEDVPVIRDFPEVFPDKLPGLPPPRQVEFCIDLIPGATLVARVPYRLAPSEMKEFFEQLRELSEKGFIRPSSSPFRAPILFVKKKDGSFRM